MKGSNHGKGQPAGNGVGNTCSWKQFQVGVGITEAKTPLQVIE